MTGEESYINERLDHLGIVAGVCQKIGPSARARCPRVRQSSTSERGNSNGSNGAQWIGLQQSAVISGAAVLREQR